MAETTALTVTEQPKTQGAMILQGALKQSAEQRALLVRFVKEQMVEGVDYGTIPGTPKPCLYKPGAEKLTELYRASVDLDIDKEVEHWKSRFWYYRIKARIVSRDSGATLGVGFGSCNSRESKYRWRDANRKCPQCGKEAIIKGKAEFGGGWLCFKKKGGCNAKFDDMASEITSQQQGRIENPDIEDCVNTILKIGTKRAHVAAALQLAGCSDLFTQDLEDLPEYQRSHPDDEGAAPRQAEKREEKPKPESKPATQAAPKPEPKKAAPPCSHEYELKSGICGKCGVKEDRPVSKQPPAVRARVVKAWNTARGTGYSGEDFARWASVVTGKSAPSSEWTAEDLDQIEAALPAFTRDTTQSGREVGADG